MTKEILKKPVPMVLEKFTSELVDKQREYVAIKASPLDCELIEDTLNLKSSKFLGKPFIPVDMDYPRDKNDNPLVLLAQINFTEMPTLEGFPENGILQLYFSSTGWWDMNNSERIIYLTDNDLQKEPKTDFSFIGVDAYEELPIGRVHSLTFKKGIDTGNGEDSQFSFEFDGKDYWEFEEALNDEDKKEFNQYFSSIGHKIGGYGGFTQEDPRGYEKIHRNDVQLLQIDVDDEIMFGDSGLGHLFIAPKDLASKSFEKAYFYWDCC